MSENKRVFIYNDQRFEDPGADYTNEAVQHYLASCFFPELARCTMQVGAEKDGVVAIEFVKAVTTKGCDVLPLVQALQAMPCQQPTCVPQATIEAVLGAEFTIADVVNRDNADEIEAFLDALEQQASRRDYRQDIKQWTTLTARPYALLTVGF